MSAIATLTAFDGAATPVVHNLLGIAISRKADEIIAEWREGTAGIPVYAQVRVTAKLSLLKSRVYKSEVRVVVPVMEAILNQNAAGYTAAPKVAYENTVVITGFFHERADVVGRRLARQLAVNIANGITTTVTPTATGPIPELIDQLVMPT